MYTSFLTDLLRLRVCFELPPISRVQEMGGSSDTEAFLQAIIHYAAPRK